MTACKRCGEASTLQSRGEAFCDSCFERFVQYKQIRHMENYKVNYKDSREKQVLLALSMGPCSIALLDCCATVLRRQKEVHQGKVGYRLHAVMVDERGVRGEMDKDLDEAVQKLHERYPECETIKVLPLETDVSKGEDIALTAEGGGVPLNEAMAKMTRTGRQDAASALKFQLISNYAQQLGVDTTIYGHSQTRLAELVITSTSKGKGSSIPTFVEQYHYPLRDILSHEVGTYCKLRNIDQLAVQYTARVPGTTKLQSIDELVHQYFRSVEESFPSVVATVVRTASKLAPGEQTQTCAICQGPMEPDTLGWIKKITVNAPTEDQSTVLCYGCVVMFRNSVGGVKWPALPKERYTTNEVLSEYEL